jgi:hypothetical protein
MLPDMQLTPQAFGFTAAISKMGNNNNRIMWIPKKLHNGIMKFIDKQLRIQMIEE